MSKTQRKRLAKSELLMHLAITAARWQKEILSQESGVLPFAEWPVDDPLVTLTRTYQLDPADLARLCDQLGDDLERRAIRVGYDDHLDAVEG